MKTNYDGVYSSVYAQCILLFKNRKTQYLFAPCSFEKILKLSKSLGTHE